ncbi:hypothetical protein RLOC_00002166 [Lonchura striata]|uniref:Uncharacterized protein n=1 Tax=Lonchura striata TaxID=40157 RepID=A0A218VEA2_9PASE|nr:hypothetical protein RLOC_00002166 [Lonchura striata domestica]
MPHVSLRLCLQPVLPDDSPTMADGGTSTHCTGHLLLPELPHAMGPPAAGCLMQLSCCWRCVGAGSALLAAACLPYSSELCPSLLLCCCAVLLVCLRAVLSFQLSQCTVQMLCKTASVAEHAELRRNTVK